MAAVRASKAMAGAYAALDVYLIRPNPQLVDPDYLAIALNSEAVSKQLRSATTGGALPRIPKQALEEVELPLPSRAAQEQIATLGALAQRCDVLQKKKGEAESRLTAMILAHILRTAA
jgi:restriction endonuclease S subunit